jgi:peptidoglycan/LPS O-acetylase OafA/YrhL
MPLTSPKGTMPKTSTTPPTEKLLGLEALRFFAAFAVLIWHYQHFSYVADTPVDFVRNQLPFYGLFYPFYEAGVYGVWLFWCISGFIFFWKYRDAIADRLIGGRAFFVLRLSRLYPLHFVTLLLVAVLQPIYFDLNGYFFVYQDNDVRHLLLQLFMASNWGFQNGLSFNGPIWSISVEVLVYAFFFLMLIATRSWLFNVVVIAACLNASGQIAACFAFFYIGGLAAIARRAVASARFGFAIEGGAWLAFVMVPLLAWHLALAQSDLFDFQFLLIYTPIVLFCLSREIRMPASLQAIVEAAGNMTYSSYLLHFPIQLMTVIIFAIMRAPIPLYDGAFFAAYLLVTLLASYFTYRYFEAPAQNLLRELLLRPRVARTQGALGLTK